MGYDEPVYTGNIKTLDNFVTNDVDFEEMENNKEEFFPDLSNVKSEKNNGPNMLDQLKPKPIKKEEKKHIQSLEDKWNLLDDSKKPEIWQNDIPIEVTQEIIQQQADAFKE